MDNFFQSEEFHVQFLEGLIAPLLPLNGKKIRARTSPSKIRITYHLFQLEKNVKTRKWKSIYQGKTAICKGAEVSRSQFTTFVNSEDFKLIGKVVHRKGTTSIYELHPWVKDLFNFLEKTGMMKNFRQNFSKWKRVFLTRLHRWLLPLLRSGHTLHQILMNRLSTKSKLKSADPNTLKSAGIKPSGSFIKPSGSRSKPECPSLPCIKDLLNLERTLEDRFKLRDGDRNVLIKTFSLNHHLRAIRLGESMLKNGLDLRMPVRFYQSCLNKTKQRYSSRYGNAL